MSLRSALRRLSGRFTPATPEIEEWEWYARNHERSAAGAALGDEWNTPEAIGVDTHGASVAEHVVATVAMPFLGTPRRLLEIGAGGGRFTECFVGRVPEIVAADTSPAMLRLLQRRFAARPGVTPMLLDGAGLQPLADASIDAAFSYDVFVHLPAWEIYNYLLELRRVLAPGGRAVIHHASSFTELGWRKFALDAERVRRRERPRGRFPLMTPDAMRELAVRSGLRVERMVDDVVRRDGLALLVNSG